MKTVTGSQTSGCALSMTKVCIHSSVVGDTLSQLAPSGVSTSREAAIVRVTSSTAMMTATASANVAISRNRKRIIGCLCRWISSRDIWRVHRIAQSFTREFEAVRPAKPSIGPIPAPLRRWKRDGAWAGANNRGVMTWHSPPDRLDEPRRRLKPQPGSARMRRGGRVVEGARLESVFTGNRNAGSNPALSASQVSIVFCFN